MEASAEPLFSRRQIISAAGALATVGITSGLLGPVLSPAWALTAAPDLSLAGFTPHVGSDFLVATNAGRRTVTLVEATASPPRPADRKGLSGDAFSLIFAGAPTTAFANGTFALSHPKMGSFSLFLAPVGITGETQRYEAVFDRRTPTR